MHTGMNEKYYFTLENTKILGVLSADILSDYKDGTKDTFRNMDCLDSKEI